uniref:Small EDRK-rich factor-like N-terminal domain-containing protein n=1 Tax=Trichuris muris TaxID=70415 RepID=A0A5S6QQ07_TRIMR
MILTVPGSSVSCTWCTVIARCGLPRIATSEMSNAEDLADGLAKGEVDVEQEVKGFGKSGKNRTKQEQHEHKKPHPEGDTRRIVNVAMNGEQNRREDEKRRLEKQQNK